MTFSATSAAELADVLADRQPGYSYSRIDNPTSQALADAIAEVEGAEAAYVFATGMAALHAAFATVLRAGDHMIVSRQIYGSVQHLIQNVVRALRRRVDLRRRHGRGLRSRRRSRPNTRLLHVETIANPTLTVADLATSSSAATARGALVTVDNTFASPYLCRPAELGADLTMEALTKWIGGHSDVLGGVGRRVAGADRARFAPSQIDTGGGLAPFSAFLVLRGLETLHVRMERHAPDARSPWRDASRRVGVPDSVWYPGLPSHPQYAIAQRQLRVGRRHARLRCSVIAAAAEASSTR